MTSAVRQVTGKDPVYDGTVSCGDLLHLFHAGCKEGCFFGPTHGGVHSVNEFVKMDDLLATAKVYALFILDSCGVAG
jgi:acetylornithine deacetylase/succinyl-diaminopimelate desuccinylase-like protein